ncbi:response regulator transcription factor [Peribacillus loiseleuriae]|uniref:response regulator transcription factor n=1 Tax=Peribacillus loiseleuriae TaxID=1679170 RepID=UPI003D052041
MKNILLVDDERWVRTALKWTINKLNLPIYVAHECTNGLEALDWIKQNNVDLVITDIRMPIMDGLTFIKQVRDLELRVDTIVISVHDEFQFVQDAMRKGVTDYLLKPIDDEELRKCLENWLKKGMGVQLESRHAEESFPLSTIDKVLQYIQETPLGEINLKEAAKKVHVNPSYLSQLFKQQVKRNFVDYLTELRMEEAKKILKTSSLRISEIAERLGYSDIAYFSNTFKRMTSFSPSEFRKVKDE